MKMEMLIMKKILSLVMVLAFCLSLAGTVLAADNYVPSIDAKPAPDVVPNGNVVAELVQDGTPIEGGQIVSGQLLITPVSEANSSTSIPEAARVELLSVYNQLKDGSMKLPYELAQVDPSEMEIRNLFDLSLINADDLDKELDKPGISLRLTLDVGVKAADKVVVMVYTNGQWVLADSVVNNGNGTITITLPDEGVVAISVNAQTPPAQTGDANRNTIAIYGAILAISMVAIVALLVVYRKKNAEN